MKFCVFFFNFLAFLVGVAAVAAGILGLTTDVLKNITSTLVSVKAILIIAIVVGAIVMAIGFCGCCGAWCENRCLLGIFVTLMLVFAIAQLAVGIYALTQADQTVDAIREALAKSVKTACSSNGCSDDFCEGWKNMEKIANCCGTGSDLEVTDSLLGICKDRHCSGEQDCGTGIQQLLKKYINIVGGVGIGFVALEILAAIFSIVLCCGIDKHHY